MIECINGWRKTTVQTEYTICHNCGHRKVIKGIRKMLPNIGVAILSKALVVEPIHLSNLATFVVSPENCDTISVPYFQCYKKRHRLERIITSIHIITHKQVVRLWTPAANTKKLCQIVKLSMNVATNSHRSSYWLYIGFVLKDFLCLKRREMRTRRSAKIENKGIRPDSMVGTHGDSSRCRRRSAPWRGFTPMQLRTPWQHHEFYSESRVLFRYFCSYFSPNI